MVQKIIWKETKYGKQGYTIRELILLIIRRSKSTGVTVEEISERSGIKKDTVRSRLRTLVEHNRVFFSRQEQKYGEGSKYRIWRDVKYGKQK